MVNRGNILAPNTDQKMDFLFAEYITSLRPVGTLIDEMTRTDIAALFM
jgi:hypothetical protein